jgi:ABC-2 type transport system ATP-binding protein
MEKLRKHCLQVKTKDLNGTLNLLEKRGYIVTMTENNMIEITGKDALTEPENISSVLVKSGFAPSLLKVEEEDLETFFLRVIKMKGGVM